jgi:hypothetical protein
MTAVPNQQVQTSGSSVENLTSLAHAKGPALAHQRGRYCENLTLEPFDQSIPSSYTTQHIIQNGDHHRGEARWYVPARSQTPNNEHLTDSRE